jgi:hypothetical protein
VTSLRYCSAKIFEFLILWLVDCYIRAYRGIEHCLLTQTAGVLFHLAFSCRACSGALPRLFPFLLGSSFDRLLFSLSWQQKSSTMTLERREHHVDCRAKKAAIFFVACEQNPATRVTIPDAMRIKGYSPSEAADRALQMQVHREAEKIKGEAIPGPPAPAAMAASALLSLASVAIMARPAHPTVTPNPTVAPIVTVGGESQTRGSVKRHLPQRTRMARSFL